MPNGIDLILADHRSVESLFEAFDRTADATLVGQILDALTAHDEAEHAALYPMAAELLGKPALLRSMAAAHSAVKQQIDHLRTQEGPFLIVEVGELRDLVTQHVADEERDLLPALQDAATPDQLEVLAARILATKQRVG